MSIIIPCCSHILSVEHRLPTGIFIPSLSRCFVSLQLLCWSLVHDTWFIVGHGGKFGALRLEGSRFESHSSRHAECLGKSFTHSRLLRFGVLTLTQYYCSQEHLWAMFPLILQSLCAHKISFVQHFTRTRLYLDWRVPKMCKSIFGWNI